MNGCRTVFIPFPIKVNGHASIAVYAIMFVVDLPDLLLDFIFLRIVICLPVFPVVIIGVRAYTQPAQKPADTEFALILVNKSISL